MTIKYSKPHSDFTKAIKHKFKKALDNKTRSVNLRGAKGVQPSKTSIEDHAPHNVYTMSKKMIEEATDFSGAKLVGMRIFHPENELAAIETVSHHTGKDHEYAGVSKGHHIQETKLALMLAEEVEEIQQKEYELAFLQVPTLFIMAVWLKTTEDWKKDIFIPITPINKITKTPQSLNAMSRRRKLSLASPKKITSRTIALRGRAFYADTFLEMLKKTNKSRQVFDPTPED